MPKLQIAFGGVPSPRDVRDVPMSAVPSLGALPKSYFVNVDNLPVWSQKKNGSCVGHAAAKYKQKLEEIETGKIIALSARFAYALAKCRDGYPGEGTYPRLVAKNFQKEGCSTEETVPNNSDLEHEAYVYNRIEANIPKEAFTEARKYAIQSYAFPNVQVVEELKRAIVEGNGAMLLMRLGKEWWYKKDYSAPSYDKNEIIPLRPPQEVVSGHEVYLYGYEDTADGRTKFYIFNSWSAAWGDSGKAWFFYDEYRSFLNEAITFVDLPNGWLEDINKIPSAETFKHVFATKISAGDRGEEVVALQTALMIDGTFSKELYSELLRDKQLGYFKPNGVTQKALYDFQVKHKIAPVQELMYVYGRWAGPKTLAKLTQLFGA